MKRPGEEGEEAAPKRPKSRHSHHQNGPTTNHHSSKHLHQKEEDASTPSAEEISALSQLPPPTSDCAHVPSYVPFTVSSSLPPLPSIATPHLATAPFTHKSVVPHAARSSAAGDISYERLEFLGDAYIELIASRLIFARFPHLSAGQQSQLRELLVKNATLAEYSRAYAFDRRLDAGAVESMMADSRRSGGKGNKGFNKVLGDVFEAYVAAVILADAEHGFAVAESWLTQLWAPRLLLAAEELKGYASHPPLDLVHKEEHFNPLETYNPRAKEELQKKLVGGGDVKLHYEKYRESIELKGDHLGQNKHFIALYLTGYGYERKLLGKGEGGNKTEAGNRAATQAMHGESRDLVAQCADTLSARREEKKARMAAEGIKGGVT